MNRVWLVFALLGCASPLPAACPPGFEVNSERAQRIEALVHAQAGVNVQTLTEAACFGPAASPGVLAGGHALLQANASDHVLAARIVHLSVHVQDGLGDGCQKGLRAALDSEVRAREKERALRIYFRLPDVAQNERDTAQDYTKRCPK